MSDDAARDTEFMDLLAPRQAKLFGYIHALVANSDDALDIYQQTVMVLWRKFDQFEADTNFTAWALRVAQFEILRYRRSAGRSRLLFDDELVQQLADSYLASAAEARSDLRFDFLQDCLGRLKSRDRSLVESCYGKGLKIQQVASALGRSSQSVCNSLRRIRRNLLACIDRKQAQLGEA